MIEAPPAGSSQRTASSSPVSQDISEDLEGNDDFRSLLSSLASDASAWLHQETELAKVELGEKLKSISKNVIKLLIGMGALATAGFVLLISLTMGISLVLHMLGLTPITAICLATLSVGVTLLLTGIITFKKAKNTLLASDILPRRAAERLQETKRWAIEKIK